MSGPGSRNNTYLDLYIQRSTAVIDRLEQQVRELDTAHLLSAQERETMRRDIEDLRRSSEALSQWVADARPVVAQVEANHASSRQIATEVVKWAIIAIVGAIVGSWAKSKGIL